MCQRTFHGCANGWTRCSSKRALPTDEARDLLVGLTDPELPPALAGALLAASSRQGRDARGTARLRAGHARAGASPGHRAELRGGGYRRHRRRQIRQLQYFHRRRAAHGGGRPAGGQARQSFGLEPHRQRRCARGAGSEAAAGRKARRGLPRGHAVHLPVRAALSPGDEGHRAGAPGHGRAHGVQHPRARCRIPPSRCFM